MDYTLILQSLTGNSPRNNIILILGFLGLVIYFYNKDKNIGQIAALTFITGIILNMFTNGASLVVDQAHGNPTGCSYLLYLFFLFLQLPVIGFYIFVLNLRLGLIKK